MATLPPNLLYLAIYNLTLRPPPSSPPDDEDAEEQAHILFYTSRERAASRNKMLRQVGLAKALVNFSELFNSDQAFDNAHSQTKKLVTISPEPDFWMHAGVELARIPRVSKEKSKTKAKSHAKENIKDRNRIKGGVDTEVGYDHVEGSVHDLVVRDELFRAYESFKLIHGSFSSILSTLGREALELQLERFFTVWAWSWSLEDKPDFGVHLGVLLHPSYQLVVSTLDAWAAAVSLEGAAIVLAPPYVFPSTRYMKSNYPSSLSRHLLSLVPSNFPLTPSTPKASRKAPIPSFDPQHNEATEKDQGDNGDSSSAQGPNATLLGESKPGNAFLGTQTMKAMDVRNWGWPGYLTFGRSVAKKQQFPDKQEKEGSSNEGSASDTVDVTENNDTSVVEGKGKQQLGLSVQVDANNLTDAISSEDIRAQQAMGDVHDGLIPKSTDVPETLSAPEGVARTPEQESPPTPAHENAFEPLPQFASAVICIQDDNNDAAPIRRKIFHITHDDLTLALVEVDTDVEDLRLRAVELLRRLKSSLEESKGVQEPGTISATQLLQPQDKYIVSRGPFCIPSANFDSNSEHLFNAQLTQERDPDILEIFSRGQNPQHWHVAKRRMGLEKDGSPTEGDVYLDIGRKEASLTDVDNVLAGIVRRYFDPENHEDETPRWIKEEGK